MKIQKALASGVEVAVMSGMAHGDITGFFDYEEWKQAVGSYQTIDFTGWEQYTVITDQYSHLGVTFTDGNDWIFHTGSFVKDGEGLHGSWSDLQITIAFDSPQLWIGVDHPGDASIELFAGDNSIGDFHHVNSGTGFFTGVISNIPFDRARIYRAFHNSPPIIDDLHWGVPAPGAVGVFTLALLCGGSRRRRR